jgi:hypothetical protein
VVCSALAYDFYWLRSMVQMVLGILYVSPQDLFLRSTVWLTYYLPILTGETLRLVGFFLALFSAYLLWGSAHAPFSEVKKHIALALVFEGVYFLTLVPTNVLRIAEGRSPMLLFLAFVLQAAAASPLLFVLGFRVWRSREDNWMSMLKWACFASVGYVVGVWVNNVFRWLSMVETVGLAFVLSGATFWGFLNSVVTLSASLAFTVAGVHAFLLGRLKRSKRLVALALLSLGLHFALYIAYSAAVGALKWVPLVEVWPVTAVGLGASLLAEDKG